MHVRFGTGLLALALCWAGVAHAASGPNAAYTVANYPVDANAEDAVRAKEKAMAEGQQAALRSLLKRLVPVTSYNRLGRLKTLKAADLVEGVAVRSERNSSTQYIASLDFSFSAQGVRDLLRREGIPFVETLAPQIVVVPAVRDASGVKDAAAWTAAWQGLDLVHTLTPVKLEALKPALSADRLKALADGDAAGEQLLTQEYRTDRVVAAIVEEEGAGKLSVTLSGVDSVGPLRLKRTYKVAPGDTAYTLELAAVIALGVLEGRWKAVRAGGFAAADVSAGASAKVAMRVEFTSLGEWNDIRGRLLDLDGADDIRIDAVSARGADVQLAYPGGPERLAETLAAQGLTLRQAGTGWVLRNGP
jgi:hypothetical protein